MNKKKVGELEGTPIVTGEKNYANEHEYYLTMNEDNTYQKLELRVSGDKFRLVLGGGSNNYPTVTAGDATKVWQVTPVQKGTSIITADVIPQRTEQLEQHSDQISFNGLDNIESFSDGAECIAIINGVEYTGKAIQSYLMDVGDTVVFSIKDENESRLFEFYRYSDDNEYIQLQIYESPKKDSYTVSLSVEKEIIDYDYNWAPGVKIPIPTAEDEGKVLVVNGVEVGSKEYELAPTQTVTFTEGSSVGLQNTSNIDKFVEGATVTSIIDGTTYTGQVIDDDGLGVAIDNGNWFLFLFEDGEEVVLVFGGSSPGTYEISVSVLGKEYSYEYQLHQLQENKSVGPKVVTILNYDPIQQNSILIDTMGNEFHEGIDYEITYKDSGFYFDGIDNIFVYNHKGNWICNMIVLVSGGYTYTKIIEESYLYEHDSYPSNLSYWDHTNNHYVGYWESA